MADIDITGFAELRARLSVLAKNTPGVVGAALYEEGLHQMREAKKRCPVAPDGGTLRASGRVSKPELRGRDVMVTMSFGGPASEYAIAVHEHLSEHSPPSWIAAEAKGGVQWTARGTGPKFLENVVLQSASTMPGRVAARIDLRKMASGGSLEGFFEL